jgi:hypothetical protein
MTEKNNPKNLSDLPPWPVHSLGGENAHALSRRHMRRAKQVIRALHRGFSYKFDKDHAAQSQRCSPRRFRTGRR